MFIAWLRVNLFILLNTDELIVAIKSDIAIARERSDDPQMKEIQD